MRWGAKIADAMDVGAHSLGGGQVDSGGLDSCGQGGVAGAVGVVEGNSRADGSSSGAHACQGEVEAHGHIRHKGGVVLHAAHRLAVVCFGSSAGRRCACLGDGGGGQPYCAQDGIALPSPRRRC